MNSNRLWTLGAVLVIVGLLAATWFLGVSPQLAAAQLADSERAGIETQNVANQSTLTSLKAQFEKIDELRAELAESREVVPASVQQSLLIGQIGDFAKANDVKISLASFSDPEASIAGSSTDPELSAAMALVSPESFLVVPLSMTIHGEYTDVMNFIDDLQTGTRLVLVFEVTMPEGRAKKGETVDISIAGETFVLLDAADVPVPAVDPAATPEATEAPAEG